MYFFADDAARLFMAGISQGCIYGLVALGFSMIYNSTGVINFAQGEFVVLGGIVTYVCFSFFKLPLWVSVILAIVTTVLVGWIVHRTVVAPLRRRPNTPKFSYSFALFGVSVVLSNLVLVLVGSESYPVQAFSPGPPAHVGPVAVPLQDFWIFATVIGVTAALTFFWTRTTTGRAMRAAAMDAFAANLIGIPVERMVMIGYLLSAGFGAVAGAVAAPLTLTGYNIGLPILIKAFVTAILGGMGNVFGALAGGLILGLVEAYGTYLISSTYRDVIVFLIMVCVLMFLPGGLFGRMITGIEDV